MGRGLQTSWVTKDGRRLRIRDMDDAHLLNTIRWLERTHEWRLLAAAVPYFGLDPDRMGEMAYEAASQECEAMAEWDVGDLEPRYNTMLDEAERRGLRSHD